MTVEVATACAVAAAGGVAVAAAVLPLVRSRAPSSLIKTNINGRPVPAVLGAPLTVGALVSLALLWVSSDAWPAASTGSAGRAVALVLAAMTVAGVWDDVSARDHSRGFSGHLMALTRRRITAGTVKIIAGGASGLVAGAIVTSGWAVLEITLLVALTANVVNLFDRAPGRAGKVALLVALPLVALGSAQWALAASGLLGALAVCLAADLDERAMLGDAGANPLGAALGLGLGLSLSGAGRVAAIVVLAALNLASERWSYSAVIERVRWLRAVDRLGRPLRQRGARFTQSHR